MKDPLLLMTYAVGVGLLLVLGRFAVTGDLNEGLLGIMSTIIGGLITALSTRKREDKGGGPDEPNRPQ